MTNPRPLGERELNLINLYAYSEIGLEPISFYTKWDVSHEQIALITSRSMSTVRRWFRTGENYQSPRKCDLLHLALMDFLLEHFEEIPPQLLNKLRDRYQR
jgi:hypothetical protein